MNTLPTPQRPLGECDICHVSVRQDRLQNHKEKVHSGKPKPHTVKSPNRLSAKPSGRASLRSLTARVLEQARDLGIRKPGGRTVSVHAVQRLQPVTQQYAAIILRSKWHLPPNTGSGKCCDECERVKPKVTPFPRSNRNFTVLLCDGCIPKVIARSKPFPAQPKQKRRKRKRGKRKLPPVQIIFAGLPDTNPRRH